MTKEQAIEKLEAYISSYPRLDNCIGFSFVTQKLRLAESAVETLLKNEEGIFTVQRALDFAETL